MNSQELPLNVPVVIADTDFIHVTATRVSEALVKVVYRYPLNADVVLEVDAATDGSTTTVTRVDNAFWSISLIGRATTERELADISMTAQFRTEAKPELRQLNFFSTN